MSTSVKAKTKCPVCGERVATKRSGRLWKHSRWEGAGFKPEPCPGSDQLHVVSLGCRTEQHGYCPYWVGGIRCACDCHGTAQLQDQQDNREDVCP